ncbi:hypothetical protein C5167_018745 [Papaver somniferum]|uniref:Uncharacterized protein n=1 Tax=Papaver somniferum TaxID=3469 RepID=A0A4Y7IRI3_PAPSO|nr:hypothetical protein C5167_018745 [Papaver somniferum]
MEDVIGRVAGSLLTSLLREEFQLPNYPSMVKDCRKDIEKAGNDIPDKIKNENMLRLCWTLVYGPNIQDIKKGLLNLEEALIGEICSRL